MTPDDEKSQTFESYHPHTSTFNPPKIEQAIVHLSDYSDIEYGISDEEIARGCLNKTFHKHFKHLVAQEIVKFNTNMEEQNSKVQNYSMSDNMPPMVNLDSNKRERTIGLPQHNRTN